MSKVREFAFVVGWWCWCWGWWSWLNASNIYIFQFFSKKLVYNVEWGQTHPLGPFPKQLGVIGTQIRPLRCYGDGCSTLWLALMTPTGLVWMARRPWRQARRACRHGRRARTSSRASEPVTPLEGGAAAKNAPKNLLRAEWTLSIAGRPNLPIGRLWTKIGQILVQCLFFIEIEGKLEKTPKNQS